MTHCGHRRVGSGEFLSRFSGKPRWLETTAGATIPTTIAYVKFPATVLKREEKNDQVDCCCWLCLSRRNFGASNDARADSSAGRHEHANPCWLRRWQGHGYWRLRRQNDRPPDPPSRPQVVLSEPPNWRRSTTHRTPVPLLGAPIAARSHP